MLINPENKPSIIIEYCVPWDYIPQAVSLAETLMKTFSWDISGIKMLPGTEGAFEISFNDKLIYSKKQTGEFPTNDQIVKLINNLQKCLILI